MDQIIFHYPPELLQLLIDTIPRLCRSKRDVVLFFRGAGVARSDLEDVEKTIAAEPEAITKFAIARTVLTRLNQRGERSLRERREVLKRVVEFEDFSTCWPNDQLVVKGLVSEIRRVISVKDSFTRISQEREAERQTRMDAQRARLLEQERALQARRAIKDDFYALFKETNPQRRGKRLEGVLNRLFAAEGILIRDAFTLSDPSGKGVFEQIDGVVHFDGHIYVVEMKWWAEPLGPGDVAQHMVRVYHREARGLFVSASGYTPAAIQTCREALTRGVFVLSELKEFVALLEADGKLMDMLSQKVSAAVVDKQPLHIWG